MHGGHPLQCKDTSGPLNVIVPETLVSKRELDPNTGSQLLLGVEPPHR